MGLMNYLRNRAGMVITFCISFAIVAFLLGDLLGQGAPFWAGNPNEVGSINGKSIQYDEFKGQVDQTHQMYRQQMGGASNPQLESWALEQVWNQHLNRTLLAEEIDRLGLMVGSAELNELVSGENRSMQIVQAFSDPQTGQFNPQQLNDFVSQVGSLPAGHQALAQWDALLDNIADERLSEKYTNLINNSIYVTTLEANEDHTQRNRLANFDYVLLNYNSIPDSEVTLTDADYNAYYNENKRLFVNKEETRNLEFVVFDASPTAQDTARVLESVQSLKAQLTESQTDSLFAAINSDTQHPYVFRKAGQVSPALDSLVFNVPVGTTVGPVLANGGYEVAKVVASKVGPDSVEARHILLNPAQEGGLESAKAKADSIKRLIQAGDNFGALALQFSVDEGSKINGGELGTFGRGMMVPAFEDAAFDNRTGDVVIAQSQFGIHIVKIDRQIGSSRVVKLAIIDKKINSGGETMNAAFNKANQFLASTTSNNFRENATEQGLVVLRADDVQARESILLGTPVRRELIRWAFESKAGDVVDRIYESENNDKYIVARVSEVRKQGQLPLNAVKSQIEGEVRNRVKAAQLEKKANEALAGAGSLSEVASKLSQQANTAENIVMANPIIPGVAQENAVVGRVFGLAPKTPSKPIRGNAGVYVVEVNSFVNPAAPSDVQSQKVQLSRAQAQRSWSLVFKALEEDAKIVDNRARFF